MCNFCEKIWKNSEEYEESFNGWHDVPAIVINPETKSPMIYQPCWDDSQYSTFIDVPLNFCPKCGRDLRNCEV